MRSRPSFRVAAIAALSAFLACTPRAELVDRENLLVLEGATLIDGTGVEPVESAVVVLDGDRIMRVGEVGDFRYPEDATVLDLQGKWLLPGFINAHVHIVQPAYDAELLRTLLAFGITSIGNAIVETGYGVQVRDKLATGEIVGPRMITCGRGINGPSPLHGAPLWLPVTTADQVRQEVRTQAENGVDFIKVYAHLPPELVSVAIEEAHAQGLKVRGHLGRTSWTEAAQAGIDVVVHIGPPGPSWELVPIAHRERFREYLWGDEDYDVSQLGPWRELVDLEGPEFEALVSALTENRVIVDATLIAFETVFWGDSPELLEEYEPDFAPEALRSKWRDNPPSLTSTWSPEDFAEAKATWPLYLEIARTLHERGITLTAGTDLGIDWIVPGVAFHRELELLVSAGIPEIEVLTIATRNGATILGLPDEVGTVEPGKQADLVVLNADPLLDIKNTRSIETVILQGELFTPTELLQLGGVSEDQ